MPGNLEDTNMLSSWESKKDMNKQPRPWTKRGTWGPLRFRSENFCRSRSASPTKRPFWNRAHKKTIHFAAFFCSIKHKWGFFQTGKGLARRRLWPRVRLSVQIKEPQRALDSAPQTRNWAWSSGSLGLWNVRRWGLWGQRCLCALVSFVQRLPSTLNSACTY